MPLSLPPNAIEQVDPAYAWWMRQRIMYPDKSLEENKLPDDLEGIHVGLFANDELTSIVSLFWREVPTQPGKRDLQFRKFCTLPAQQGKGYGKTFLLWCRHRAFAVGKHQVLLDVETENDALKVYGKSGFQAIDTVAYWKKAAEPA